MLNEKKKNRVAAAAAVRLNHSSSDASKKTLHKR